MFKEYESPKPITFTVVVLLFVTVFVIGAEGQIQPIRSFYHPSPSGTQIYAVVFSPDGKTIATGVAGAKIWNVATGELLLTVHEGGNYVQSLAFSADGRYLVTGDWEAMVEIWDVKTGERIQSIKFLPPEEPHIVPWMFVYSLAFSPDGRYVLANCENNIALFDVQTGSELYRFPGGWPSAQVAYFPDGKRIVVPRSGANVCDARTGTPLYSAGDSGAWLSPYGTRTHLYEIVSYETPDAGVQKRLVFKTWDANTGELLHTSTKPYIPVSSVAFSPDGNMLLIGAEKGEATLELLKPSGTTEQLRSLSVGQSIRVSRAVFSPDGNKVVTVNGNTVYLWDISDLAAGVKKSGEYEKRE